MVKKTIVVRIDKKTGNIRTDWYHPDLKGIVCHSCTDKNSEKCEYCHKTNQWCG